MLKKHSQLFGSLFAASDLLVVSLAWVMSYWLRFYTGIFPVEKGIPESTDYVRMLIFVWLIWGTVFRRLNLYRPMRGQSRFHEIWLLVRANALGVVLLLAATYLFREKVVPFSRLVFLIFWGLSTVMTVISRSMIRAILRDLRRRGYNLRYALVVGSGALAEGVASRMASHPEYGFELVGCLTNDEDYYRVQRGQGQRGHGAHQSSAVAEQAHGVPQLTGEASDSPVALRVVGTYSDLLRFLESGTIDQVIVAMPLSDHHLLEEVIHSVGDSMVDVRIVPDVHQFIQLGSRIEEFDGLSVISLASTPLSGPNVIMKRAVDLLLGTVLLALSLPFLAFIAALVRLSSKGPILYSQERVGLDGRTFNIYKFRTMYTNAEQRGACFAVRDDPRTTPLGRLLRRFSLDELPQLWNVVKGEMSLVGPRPERPVFIQEFRRRVPRYMLRHKVQAGMTGWAQVNGWRGNTSIERRIEHDLYYIENWSLSLDLKILGLTLVNGFRDRNAY